MFTGIFAYCFADGADYILLPTDLTFPVGSQKGARQCVIVNITDDEVVEYQEYFYIELITNDTCIEILRIRGQQALQRICIRDNDGKFVGIRTPISCQLVKLLGVFIL